MVTENRRPQAHCVCTVFTQGIADGMKDPAGATVRNAAAKDQGSCRDAAPHAGHDDGVR